MQVQLQPVLTGPTLLLRPLVEADFEPLYAAAADPLIWVQNPQSTRWQRDVFRKIFDSGLESRGAFVVIDRESGAIIGTSRYYEWEPDKREIAIGYTFLTRKYWGGATNQEMKKLMLDHIFQWADTVWFHIGAENWRSRKALEKIGGVFSHFRDQPVDGKLVPYCCYKIVKPR